MTGRIKVLSAGSASGFIEAENGSRIHFDSAAVLAYDVTYLSVGQLVTFDVENGLGRKAVNICVQRPHQAPPPEGKRKESMLRYVGFDQTRAIRTYRFERTSLGLETETFAVTTDITLFTKYHVAIQEGPALCLRLLTLGMEGVAVPPIQRSLTEQDIKIHVASRPVPGTRPHHKRTPPRPAAAHGV
jgi:cold shock CspA family protein